MRRRLLLAAFLLVGVIVASPRILSVLAGQVEQDRNAASAPAGPDCCPKGCTVKEPPIQVVAWGAEWCRFCKKNKPELLRLQKTGKYVILFIDTDEQPELAREHKITRLPTYFVVVDKDVVLRTTSLTVLKSYRPPKKEKQDAPAPN